MTSTGISACSARTGLSVCSFQRSVRFLTFSFVSVFSFLFHPVRWLSPPSVVQSYSGAPPDCAVRVATAGHRPEPHTSPQQIAMAARLIAFLIIDLDRVVIVKMLIAWYSRARRALTLRGHAERVQRSISCDYVHL